MSFLSKSQRDAIAQFVWGVRVDRATATLPQTAHAAIFNITGGRVIVNLIVGGVTTIIQAQANATKLTAIPTVGSSVDLCATGDINGLEVGGTIVVPVATFATAMQFSNAGANIIAANPFLCNVGAIHLNCAASNTGSVKWSIFFTALDDGATVTAA